VPPFRPLTQAELDRLSDDDLIAYLREAAAAGASEHARLALQVLVFGFWDLVEARLSARLPAWAVEDETSNVIARAITSSFAGTSEGEFRSWLTTIIKRAVADFYRAQERTPKQTPLHRTTEDGEQENLPGRFEADGAGYVEVQTLVESCLDELSDPHRRVVEILVFEDRDAKDAAAEVDGITEANAYQIVSRFRRRLRELLEEDNP
jgi:RNA polymerase sigma factor (sigma-70 family)